MAGAARTKESQGCVIGSKITRSELTQIQDLIDAGVYLNASDFVREAIRDKLAAIKVIKCRDVDYETAKRKSLDISRESKRLILMRSLRIWSWILTWFAALLPS
jgi:Arc/MetJ-type ribon-helix-helix transcriptional regulator